MLFLLLNISYLANLWQEENNAVCHYCIHFIAFSCKREECNTLNSGELRKRFDFVIVFIRKQVQLNLSLFCHLTIEK